MGTSLSEIYDLFMQKVTDYRLDDLYESSVDDFENYLQAWLEFSITDFDTCDQSLDYNTTTKEFPATLSRDNKNILAHLMMKHWLQKCVKDITQMNLHITDRDFKVASEAQNLREKENALNVAKEECSQMLISYAYKRNVWTEWFNQDFTGT